MNISIEREPEEDGHWIAEVQQLPGCPCYGTTADQAMAKAQVYFKSGGRRAGARRGASVDITISVSAAA